MAYTLYPLKEINPSLLPRIAEIQLGDAGLLSKLGYPFVLRYFEMAIKDERAFGFYAQENETGEIMGLSLASPEPSTLTSNLPRDRSWFIKQILKVLLTRPLVFLQMIISSITIKGQMEDDPHAIECVYFTVDPKFRGHHLGRTLQKALMDEGRKQGYKKIFASIETWNEASLKATQANGFTIAKTYREGKYHRHRLESKL
jgi:RimJ/RimL family protein N-acetyltransferase